MVILNLEKYKSLKDEINRIKNGESNNKIEDIIIEMKKCINFKEENKSQKLNQNVEKIITVFADKFEEMTGGTASETFTEGFCYYFALVLKQLVEEILKEQAQIYTTHLNGAHAIVKVGNSFYDINGNINKRYDRLGYLRNYIDSSLYRITDEEDFLFFSDLCTIGRAKEIILKEEKVCDTITDELIKELKYS